MNYSVKCDPDGQVNIELVGWYTRTVGLSQDGNNVVYQTNVVMDAERARHLLLDVQIAIKDSHKVKMEHKRKELESLKRRVQELEDEINEPLSNRF